MIDRPDDLYLQPFRSPDRITPAWAQMIQVRALDLGVSRIWIKDFSLNVRTWDTMPARQRKIITSLGSKYNLRLGWYGMKGLAHYPAHQREAYLDHLADSGFTEVGVDNGSTNAPLFQSCGFPPWVYMEACAWFGDSLDRRYWNVPKVTNTSRIEGRNPAIGSDEAERVALFHKSGEGPFFQSLASHGWTIAIGSGQYDELRESYRAWRGLDQEDEEAQP